MNSLPKPLLDDLRHATEFYRCEQAVTDGQHQPSAEANEWLLNAALRLGEARLSAASSTHTDEAPHA